MPTHRHPFGPGQTQRRTLRDSRNHIELDPLDEAPTHRRDPRPIAEILAEPIPVAVPRDASATLRISRTRPPPSTAVVLLWIFVGITIGMIAMLAMLRA